MPSVFKIFVIILLQAVIVNGTFAQRLPFKNYTTRDGLPQAQVSFVMQDAKGFLWFVSNSGISRYDGAEFRTYSKNDGLPSNVGIQLAEDARGRMWALMVNGLAVFEVSVDGRLSNLRRFDQRNGLPSMDYSSMLLDSAGVVWLGTRGSGLIKVIFTETTGDLQITDRVLTDRTTGLSGNAINQIFRDGTGLLWVATDAGVSILDSRDREKIHTFSTKNGLRSDFATSIAQDGSGTIWVGTRNGISKFVDILTSPNPMKFRTFGVAEGLPNGDIRSIATSQLGNLWVGTANGLVKITFSEMSRTDRNPHELRLTAYNEKHGLIDDLCRYVFTDRENNIWVTTYGTGISRLSSEKFHAFSSPEGLAHDVPGPVATGPHNDIWVGTNNGISVFSVRRSATGPDKYSIRNLTQQDGLPSLGIWDFAVDANGTMWVATEKGVAHFNGTRFVTVAGDASAENVRQIEFDLAGNLWIGTTSGLSRYRKSGITKISRRDGMPSDYIRRLVLDGAGNLWIGTNNGLARIDRKQTDADRPTVRTMDLQLSERIINDIFEDKNHDLWLASDGSLAHVFLDEKFEIQKTDLINIASAGFQNTTLTCIEQDASGYLWICTNKGLHQFDIDRRTVVDVYLQADGLAGDEGAVCDAMVIDHDGTLWISMFGGVTRYLPSLDIGVTPPIPVFIKRFTANAASKSLSEVTALDYDERTIELQYTALSFKRDYGLKYQYRLSGFDKAWSAPTPSRSVRYTNLDHGDYRFEVKAVIPGATQAPMSASIDFSIAPPLWRTWWFMLAAFTGIVGLGYLAYNRRITSLERHSAELEYRINLRTHEIRKQNEEINIQHQALEKQKTELEKTVIELSKAQTDLIHSKKMASLVQIVAGIAHEMNNPLANIYGNAVHFKEYLDNLRKLLSTYDEALLPGTDLQKIVTDLNALKDEIEYDYMIQDISGIVNSIEKSSTRLMQIMKDLRKFSRIDESESMEVNLNDNLESIVELFMNQYRFSIKLEKVFAPLPPLLCHPQELNQVFMQILLNAAQAILDYQELALKEFKNPTLEHDFDLDRGHIKVETRLMQNVALRDLDLSLQDIYRGERNAFAQVRISDDGIGMKDDIRERIFDPFFTTRKVGEGVGLGLSVSYSIIEKHRGRIYFNTEFLNGTEFIVELPVGGKN